MYAIKLFFLLFLNAFKTWVLGLGAETKQLGLNLYARVRAVALAVGEAVKNVALIPVHAVQWLWGCAKASWNALASVWRR